MNILGVCGKQCGLESQIEWWVMVIGVVRAGKVRFSLNYRLRTFKDVNVAD